MSQPILAITEQVDGVFKNISFEVISSAKKIVDASGGPLTAAVMGSGVEAIAGQAAEYGADRILVAEHDGLKDGLPDACIETVAQLVAQYDWKQNLLLLGALNLPLGADGSEYGGIETGADGLYYSSGPSVFAQLAWYF